MSPSETVRGGSPDDRCRSGDDTEGGAPTGDGQQQPEIGPQKSKLENLLHGVATALLAQRRSLHSARSSESLKEVGEAAERNEKTRKRDNEERRRQRLDLQLLEEQIEDLAMQASTLAQRFSSE
ncbi:hypothetical protein [Actinomycetospora flava]|uniref:Uncharacterized protein n=1 Tax=Actinomycetospora flava TaxID=3129232 RepID=A0ABU8MH27_9PSEU